MYVFIWFVLSFLLLLFLPLGSALLSTTSSLGFGVGLPTGGI